VKLSTLSQSKPIAPFNLSFEISLPLPNLESLLPRLGARLVQKSAGIWSNDQALGIIYDIITMTRYTETAIEGMVPYHKDDTFYEYVNYQNLSIEHRLLSYPFEDGLRIPKTTTSNTIENSCRLACILYVNTALSCGYPTSSAIIRNIVKALKEALYGSNSDDTNLEWVLPEHNDVFFWVLFMGLHSSLGQHEEQVFQDSLWRMAITTQLASWENAREVLERFLYVDRIHLHSLKQIWSNKL
jgi:hypothetical protein